MSCAIICPVGGDAMARKDQELRPVMTRIPEGLRRQLERAAVRNGRSMNAEIISRLEHSFTAPKLAAEVAFGVTNAHLARDQEFASRLKHIEELLTRLLPQQSGGENEGTHS
jgi:hypothetical protein